MMGTTLMELATGLESTNFLSGRPMTKSVYFERYTDISAWVANGNCILGIIVGTQKLT